MKHLILAFGSFLAGVLFDQRTIVVPKGQLATITVDQCDSERYRAQLEYMYREESAYQDVIESLNRQIEEKSSSIPKSDR